MSGDSNNNNNDMEEMQAWMEITDQLVRDTCNIQESQQANIRASDRRLLEAKEAEFRSRHVVDQALEFHAMVSRFIDFSTLVTQSNDAVAELLAWKDIIDSHPLPHMETTIAEKEAQLANAVNKPEIQQLEIERDRMEAAREDARLRLETTVENLESVQKEKKAMERQLDELLVERSAAEESIHALRVERIDEKQKLESELKDLREQIRTERELLQDLKTANNAAAIAPSAPYNPTLAQNGSSPIRSNESSTRELSPIVGQQTSSGMNYGSSSTSRAVPAGIGMQSPRSPNGSPTTGDAAPSLNSGLRALQNVREQLREIRESHMSPGRAHSMSDFGTPGSPANQSSTGMQRANTSIGSGYSSASRTGLPSTSMASDDGASPWRQRLSKLQGDLRMLKAELGTSM